MTRAVLFTPGGWSLVRIWHRVCDQGRALDAGGWSLVRIWHRVCDQGRAPHAGRGSAIFLHDDTTSGVTAGCVALPASTLDSVLAWLDPAQRPLISIGTPDEVGPPAPLAGKTGYQTAFQGSNGDLWTAGSSGKGDAGYGMKTGTSPAITALAGGGFEVAFEANTGLWTAGSSGSGDSGYGMFVGSSPAITALAGHGFEVAFEANNADLWTAGSSGSGDAGYGMFGSTSAAITALGGGGSRWRSRRIPGTCGMPGRRARAISV